MFAARGSVPSTSGAEWIVASQFSILHAPPPGVTRGELVTSDRTRRQLRFQDLRATGITWRAIREDGPLKIMKAAGHKDFTTTMAYVRDAEQVSDSFAPLPEGLSCGALGNCSLLMIPVRADPEPLAAAHRRRA